MEVSIIYRKSALVKETNSQYVKVQYSYLILTKIREDWKDSPYAG